LKPSAYATALAIAAGIVSSISAWCSGLWLEAKLAACIALWAYWFYWWRRQQLVRWCVLYPNKVVLGINNQPLAYGTQCIGYWGLCFVIGKHCLWRDQITPQQWRYLQVLKRW